MIHRATGNSGGFRGGSGGLLEPPSGSKLYQFHRNQVKC